MVSTEGFLPKETWDPPKNKKWTNQMRRYILVGSLHDSRCSRLQPLPLEGLSQVCEAVAVDHCWAGRGSQLENWPMDFCRFLNVQH